jgi:hypothetical protein
MADCLEHHRESPIVSPWTCIPQFSKFNGKLRDECLKGEILYSLKEAQIMIEAWRVVYNTRGHTRRWAAKSNFTAYGCDVDSLGEIDTKTRAGHARTGHAHVECGNLVCG